MAEVIAHLLETPTRFHEMPGAGVSQAVWPAAFLRQPLLGKMALDDVVKPTCRQRPVRGAQRQEDDPAFRLGSAIAQVSRDSVTDPGLKKNRLFAPALRANEADPIRRPVDAIET
jgi:hypothetical protein